MADDPVGPPRTAPPDTVEISAGGAGSPERPALDVTRAFGDYELLGEIERGGMGVVYRARERHSGRLVALKMMLDQNASSQADLSRFVLEAQATAELSHPGVVSIHAWGVHDGHPFYTMDFVAGQPLHRLIERGPLPTETAVRYLLGVSRALGAAHALGIVHRDLKPSNVMIDQADQPRVLDFGLAKRHRPVLTVGDLDEETPLDALPALEPSIEDAARKTPRTNTPITEKGAILGTPSYMAPEQVRAEHARVGPASDVHALGAIFYEMLSGRPPFQGDTSYATLMEVLQKEPPPLRSLNPRVPGVLAQLVHRCLAKEMEGRYADATALAEDLEYRWQRHTLGRRYARLAFLALAVLVGFQLLQPILASGPLLRRGGLEAVVDWLAPGVEALSDGAAVLDRLLHGAGVVAGPLLGGLGLLAWSAAWVWYAVRSEPVCLQWVILGVVATGLGCFIWLNGWAPGVYFLPWLLGANGVGAFIAAVARRATAAARSEEHYQEGEAYLQKLFSVRSRGRPHKTAVVRQGAVELEDFAMGKRLHGWDGGSVHWARQQSLGRAVLIWQVEGVSSDPGGPGVMVRHSGVLSLHALSDGPQGRLIVTEPAAASPLVEILHQRPLSPREATSLVGRLAEIVQAFHDQGTCHGRVSPEWVLIRGELDPVLCPCGVPSQAPADRSADVQALGKLLHGWLPPRAWLWRWEILAPVYQTCDAARNGFYERPADFAADLDRAGRAGRGRWRERWATAAAFALSGLALGLPLLDRILEQSQKTFSDGLANAAQVLVGVIALQAAAATLFAYTQARAWVQQRRLGVGRNDPVLAGTRARRVPQLILFVGLAALTCGMGLGGVGAFRPAALAGCLSLLAGYALAGFALAGLVTFGEFLIRSLRRPPKMEVAESAEENAAAAAPSEAPP